MAEDIFSNIPKLFLPQLENEGINLFLLKGWHISRICYHFMISGHPTLTKAMCTLCAVLPFGAEERN